MQETGTAWLQALAAPTVRHSQFVVRITLAETVAAITRRERGGSITPQDAATAVADFQLDFARQYRIVEVSAGLVAQAATWREGTLCVAMMLCSSRRPWKSMQLTRR